MTTEIKTILELMLGDSFLQPPLPLETLSPIHSHSSMPWFLHLFEGILPHRDFIKVF